MKACKMLIITLIGSVLFSCGNDNSSNFKELAFMPEIYPYTDTIFANHYNDIQFFTFGQQQKNKLILYVGGDCSVCFAQIVKWQEMLNKDKELFNDLAIAVVIQTEQIQILEYNLEKIKNSLPIYIDTTDALRIYNPNIFKNTDNVLSLILDHHNLVLGRNIEKFSKRKIKKLLSRPFINNH